MLKRLLGSGVLAALVSAIGVAAIEKAEKKLAGGKALSVRGLMARHTLMAITFRRMKQHRSKAD